MKHLALVVTLALAGQACGPVIDAPEPEGSQTHFITFGPGVSGLVARVKKQRIAVCLSGISEGERARWATNLKSVIMKWVAPLRELTSDRLVQDVDTVQRGQPCDVDVSAAPGTHANASVGGRPSVRMSPTGYFGSYNVLFHEFGHVFALSDTYYGGRSGQCQPGQPQSVMCNTSFSELQTDDVAGVTRVFKNTFPNDRPPPPGGRNDLNPLSMFAALGQEVGPDSYELYAAASADGAMFYCEGASDLCQSADGIFKPMKAIRRADTTYLHATGAALKLSNGMHVTMRHGEGAAATYKEIAFRPAANPA